MLAPFHELHDEKTSIDHTVLDKFLTKNYNTSILNVSNVLNYHLPNDISLLSFIACAIIVDSKSF